MVASIFQIFYCTRIHQNQVHCIDIERITLNTVRKIYWQGRGLRTFARKSSIIDLFFIKLLLQLDYELLLSKMQKTIGGVTDFVSEIRYFKGHPNFKKSVFLTRYGSNVC